jgi:carboxymethylenebutenolidase
MGEMIKLGALQGFLSRPESPGPWPAVIVIHEWFGLDEQTKSIARRIAELGYLSVAPDLYHGELAEIGDSDKASAIKDKYLPTAPAELQDMFDALKKHKDCSGRVGCVGFCFGGRMSLTLADRPVDAVCTFYGGGMQNILIWIN